MLALEDIKINLQQGKKVYFASDIHLGSPSFEASKEREHKFVQWLDMIKADAGVLFLVGDIFDFWFEYKHVIPKGFLHFQAKLLELKQAGVEVIFFKGNHDMWMFDYFTKEMGIKIYSDPHRLIIDDVKIYIHHGDGLGKGDKLYKALKKIFTNRFFQWLFRWVHPDMGMGIANAWSRSSRGTHPKKEVFHNENEWLWEYAKEIEEKEHFDCFLFGHRHLDLDLPIGDNSRYINIGEWFSQFTYGVCDGKTISLLKYGDPDYPKNRAH